MDPLEAHEQGGPEPAPQTVRHVIAVGGGRGGSGKSILAINLAVYLAQLGRRVAIVDADPAGAQLHTMLGIELPEAGTQTEETSLELVPIETPVPGLALIPQVYTPGSTVPVRPGRKARWAQRLRQLNVEYVLVDLGAGTAPASLDLFLAADFGILVASPEPPSVEATYRFVRALFSRQVRRALLGDRYKLRLLERAQAALPALPSPQELVAAIARYDTRAGEIAAHDLAALRPRLVVNHSRLRTDADLGEAMSEMARRYLGVRLDYLGNIEHDDSVWLSVVRRRPLLIDSPTSKSARNVERIARRLQALAATPVPETPPEPAPLLPQAPNLYEVLGTHRGATDEELRRAYKRQREIFQPGSLALTSLLTLRELGVEQALLDEAHATLLDPIRRRAYDVSIFPEPEQQAPEQGRKRDTALEAERALAREELTRELNAETEFTGRLLRKVRESQGVEIEEIARLTKISAAYLRAVEAEDFPNLPALVYTRGFVQQFARHLSLDPAQVTRTYLRRMRHWRATSERGTD